MATLTSKATTRHHPKPYRWILRGVLLALLLWIAVDLLMPSRNSLRQFNPTKVARLETAMWRSYYEKKPVLLFWQLATGLRQQFHAPFWRSFVLGFQATKAAFVFKQSNKSKGSAEQVLPDLIGYYTSIQELSVETFDVSKVAQLELNWWIVHRRRDRYSYGDLANALVNTSAALYNQPATSFTTYGRLRADAMQMCDQVRNHPNGATEADWLRIETLLNQAWGSFYQAVQIRH